MKVIAEHPPKEMYGPGVEVDCCCARCGSSVDIERCEHCEDGFDGHECGEDTCVCLYPEDNVPCQYCRGTGRWARCMSSAEWCESHSLPGREGVERGMVEWFTVECEP